jgi:hypothetical protein
MTQIARSGRGAPSEGPRGKLECGKKYGLSGSFALPQVGAGGACIQFQEGFNKV